MALDGETSPRTCASPAPVQRASERAPRFLKPASEAAYRRALTEHDLLSAATACPRALAYQRGFDGLPFVGDFAHWPEYAAGAERARRGVAQ